jgi:hypothetical protein
MLTKALDFALYDDTAWKSNANAPASIGGGEIGVTLEKVSLQVLGNGKARSLCGPNHRHLKGQKLTT